MNRIPFIKKLIATPEAILLSSKTSMSYTSIASKNNEKLGFTLIGLGYHSKNQLAPSLLETKHCYLSAIVTGTKEKETIWSKKNMSQRQTILNL